VAVIKERGIDVSHWQGHIDWKKVAKDDDNIKFVIVKATQGTSVVDPYFKTNVINAHKAGLEVGAYHFANFRNLNEAMKESNFFASNVKKIGVKFEKGLALDLETNRGNLNKKQLTDAVIAFLDNLHKLTGAKVILYTNKHFYDNLLDMRRLLPKYKLWIARYGVSDPGVEGYDMWQYTDHGKVDGISGYVDMDVIYNKSNPKTQSSSKSAPSTASASKSKSTTNNKPKTTTTNNTTIYIVKKGDTLSGIAQKYHTTVSAIQKLNNIKDKDYIVVGERLKVPSNKPASTTKAKNQKTTQSNNKKSSKPVSKPVYHKVVKGDTVAKLAKKYGSTIYQIKAWNKLDKNYTIYVGKTIRVK